MAKYERMTKRETDWQEVIGNMEVSVKTDGTSYVTGFEKNYFELLEALRKKDAKIAIKAMDVTGAWVASADVPVASFKRGYSVFRFFNEKRLFSNLLPEKRFAYCF